LNWAQAASLHQRGNIADRLEEAEADGLNDKLLSELCVRDELEAIRNDLLFNNIIW